GLTLGGLLESNPSSVSEPAHHERQFFCSGFQLRMSVMGVAVDASVGWLIRNRPSRETVYCCLLAPAPGASIARKSATGVPGTNVAPEVVTDAAISFPSGAMK